MADSDITVEILKDIRSELRGVRTEVHDLRTDANQRFESLRTDLRDEIHGLRNDTNQRFGVVETALLDLSEQQRFVVRYLRAIAERHAEVEPRVSALESRVGKLETR